MSDEIEELGEDVELEILSTTELNMDNMDEVLTMMLRWSYEQHGREGIIKAYLSFEKALFSVLQEVDEVDVDVIQH